MSTHDAPNSEDRDTQFLREQVAKSVAELRACFDAYQAAEVSDRAEWERVCNRMITAACSALGRLEPFTR